MEEPKRALLLNLCMEHLNHNIQFPSMSTCVMSIVGILLACHPLSHVSHVIHSGIEVHLLHKTGRAIPKGHKQQLG